jgi:NhaA family Na+:H+ antiporter
MNTEYKRTESSPALDGRLSDPGDRQYNAPWEHAFERVLGPFEEFIHNQTTAGMLLMVCALIALVLANSPLAGPYLHVLHTPMGFGVGDWSLELSLHHWINDGLMALFFFVMGLEIKREILVGELATPRQAALPIIAAIGGMLVPALIYMIVNPGGAAAQGWGVPMATDIAFAVGALVLLGSRIPQALIVFLVALAIVDDLGAVVVIALFYTDTIVLPALAAAGAFLAALIVMNLGGVRRPLPYFVLGLLLWLAMLKSGVHATIAGVLLAFTIPARARYDPLRFHAHVMDLMQRFALAVQRDANILVNDKLHAIVQSLERGAEGVETPMQRLQHLFHQPVALLVIPVFALANAGVQIPFESLGDALRQPVTLGVILGLVLGKFVGIAGSAWLALQLGVGQLPAGTRFVQVAGVALLGGIGFTMSIFIAELGFAAHPEMLVQAKIGILCASLCAGVLGYVWLLAASRAKQ